MQQAKKFTKFTFYRCQAGARGRAKKKSPASAAKGDLQKTSHNNALCDEIRPMGAKKAPAAHDYRQQNTSHNTEVLS